MTSSDSISNGIEERTPARECGRDSSSSSTKRSRRVSWNIIESDVIVSPNHETTHCHSSYPSHQEFPESPISAEMGENLDCRSTVKSISTTIAPEEIETEPIGKSKKLVGGTTTWATTENNESNQTAFSGTNMDSQTLDFSTRRNSLTEEELIVINRNLERKTSRLKEAVFTLQKHDFAQKGKSLVQEYQLRADLEAICEDVLFLRDKRDRFAETLRHLQVKNNRIQRSDRDSKSDSDSNNADSSGHDKSEEQKTIRLSDASVQTEDWPIDYYRSSQPDTSQTATSMKSKPIAAIPL